jgi:16S rRNA (guanine527-N7)-methyltransferase
MKEREISSTLAMLQIDNSVQQNVSRFLDLFLKWNASINLSAASTRDELIEHVVDSLHVVPFLRDYAHVLDVGSGGGFPVVIAAICLPTVRFTSLEPVHKKHAFLKTAARELGLANLTALAERLEDHESLEFDAATSRATLDLRDWLEAGLKVVRAGGAVIGFEAVRRDDLPASVTRHPYSLGDKQRAIVIARNDS